MNDLVSYNGKHNEENGEGNRDGSDSNWSYNHGYEGPTANPAIERMRNKQMRNFILTLFITQGTPMRLAGDEFRRGLQGNNNAYCQDNDISWINWSLAQKNKGLVRFTKNLIAYRKSHSIFSRKQFFTDCYDNNTVPEIAWYDINAKNPDWSKQKRFLAFKLNGSYSCHPEAQENDFYIATNTDIYDLTITLPALSDGRQWHLVADTSLSSPEDIAEPGNEELLREQRRYVLLSGATVVLIGK
jgi:glycogen operon protein